MPSPSPRTPLVAANWKMNKTRAEAADFLEAFLPEANDIEGVELVVCPPFTALQTAIERCAGSRIRVAAQNAHAEVSGAFTGEVAMPMLVDVGAWGVVLGHSERRQLFGETDEALANKVPAALDVALTPILCVGETEAERDAGETEAVLERQLAADLGGVDGSALAEVVVAYEPIWAIGTGRNATPEQAQEAVAFCRAVLRRIGGDAADAVRILYGGSMKPGNAAALMGEQDVDGGLVGGASLDPSDFTAIARAAAP
jgi:triosephosphate isomerase (TIM)